jgi:hypothetical protein
VGVWNYPGRGDRDSEQPGSDAARHAPAGNGAVYLGVYRRWEIRVERREVGMTLHRERFGFRIAEPETARVEYVTGFTSRLAAIQAAQRRIDVILDIQDPPAAEWPSHRRRRRSA